MRKLLILTLLASVAPTIANAADLMGVWSGGEGRIHVKIAPCENALCGKIVWLSDAASKELKEKGQSILGVKLLSDLRPSPDRKDQWEGNVYNLQDGHTYNVYLRPSEKSMEVEGCLLVFCRTQVWPRVTTVGDAAKSAQ